MAYKPQSRIEELSFVATRWVGSVPSLVTHTVIFVASFLAVAANVISFDRMLLVLTTILSLEAIYLAIFIQMTVNRQSASLEEVEHDIDEMQEDVDEIQEDIGEIQKDVDEIQEDVSELTVEEEEELAAARAVSLDDIRMRLGRLLEDIDKLSAK